jgi:uncharacterized protein
MVENAKAFVEKYMRGDASGHDYFHTLRVLHLAETIARQESLRNSVDMQTVQLIALLHDVDDRKLSPDTHENLDRARSFLNEQGAGSEMTARILESIRNLSFGGTGANVPESLEGKIVQDADRLDAIGAIGIARAFAFGGSRGREMYDPSEPPQMEMDGEAYAKSKGHTVNHFYEKLLRLKDLMNTETGKAMAQHRHGFMENFLEEFYGEWDGII